MRISDWSSDVCSSDLGGAASFNALQQRLGRKTVSKAMLTDYPAFVRPYDLLVVEDEDLRPLSWEQRREILEAFVPRLDPERFDISPVIPARSEERRGGKEWVSTLRSRWSPYN